LLLKGLIGTFGLLLHFMCAVVAFLVCYCCISWVLLLHFLCALVAFHVCYCCISCVLLLHFTCLLFLSFLCVCSCCISCALRLGSHSGLTVILMICTMPSFVTPLTCAQVGKPQRPYGHFDDMYHALICNTSHMRSGWQATAALRSF
jgi:hypothetical protein